MTDAKDDINDKPAEEGAPDAPADAAAGKSRKKKILLFIVLPLILIIGLGAGAYFTGLFGEKKAPDCEKVVEGDPDYETCAALKATEVKPVDFIEVPGIIVNLNSPAKQPRFLKISMKIELESTLDKQNMEKLLPRVVDQFQMYLRELRVDDLRGSAGIYRLKIELLNRVRAAAPDVKVRDVLFQEILVQ